MTDMTDNVLGATTGLLAIAILANVAGKVMGGLNSTKEKSESWLSSKSSKSK